MGIIVSHLALLGCLRWALSCPMLCTEPLITFLITLPIGWNKLHPFFLCLYRNDCWHMQPVPMHCHHIPLKYLPAPTHWQCMWHQCIAHHTMYSCNWSQFNTLMYTVTTSSESHNSQLWPPNSYAQCCTLYPKCCIQTTVRIMHANNPSLKANLPQVMPNGAQTKLSLDTTQAHSIYQPTVSNASTNNLWLT